jgi:hypothetical protein
MGRPRKKHPGGRPTVMTDETIGKLEEAFALGCTDKEACLFAGISVDSLYKHQRENPEFIKRKEALKETPVLQARTTVVRAVKENPTMAFQYLERKRRDEFGPHQKVDIKGDVTIKWEQ